MNTPVKKLFIYGLTIGIAETVKKATNNKTILWKLKKVQESAQFLLDTTNVKINNTKIKQVEKNVSEFFTTDHIDILDSLCFVLCGYTEFVERSSKQTDMYDSIIKRIMWLIYSFDAKLDKPHIYDNAKNSYERWCT